MTYDVFTCCKLVTEANKQVFTEDNIKAAFRQTGIWPINPKVILDKPMPKSSAEVSSPFSVTEVCNILEEKRAEIRRGLNIEPAVLSRGFVASTYGINLTAPDALKLARESHEETIMKKTSKDAAAIARSDKRKARLTRRLMLELHVSGQHNCAEPQCTEFLRMYGWRGPFAPWQSAAWMLNFAPNVFEEASSKNFNPSPRIH
jgi:hypothetical protein